MNIEHFVYLFLQYHKTISEHDDLKWIRDTTLNLQRSVLAEFGYNDGPGIPILNIRILSYLFYYLGERGKRKDGEGERREGEGTEIESL